MTTVVDQPQAYIARRHTASKWEWAEAFMEDPSLRPMVRLFLHTIATFADGKGSNCRPSVPKVAALMGVGRSAAFEALAEARRAGWVQVEERPGCPNLYHFTVPDPSGSADPTRPATRTPPVQSGGRVPDHHQTNNQTTSPDDDMCAEWDEPPLTQEEEDYIEAACGVLEVVKDLGFGDMPISYEDKQAVIDQVLRMPKQSRFPVLARASSWGPFRGTPESVRGMVTARILKAARELQAWEKEAAHG